MDLSIVIVNYNVRDLLVDAIESVIAASDGLEVEIIVVDNASTDGAMELLAREYPDVHRIRLERNIGFGGANNRGIEVARGEYILLLNPDTVLEEETLREMRRFMERTPRAGVATSKILRPDGSLEPGARRGFPSPWSAFARISGLSRIFPNSRLFGAYHQSWNDPDETHRVEAISGCFMFFRADLLKSLGGFDPDFFMYGEDLDLCRRVELADREIWYHPATSIVHLKGESTSRSSLDSIRMFYDAMVIFAEKHFRQKRLLLPLLRLGIRLRMGIARFTTRFSAAGFAIIDIVAVLIGLIAGSLLRTGTVSFPENTMPWVFVVSPLPFLIAIGMAGGYGANFGRLSRVLLGYLGGFFILSTLPYFFETYRFSRGIVLAMTAISAGLGLAARFLILLYRRTFGEGAIRRVALLGSQSVTSGERNRIRRLFLGRPTRVVGLITPRFSDLDGLGQEGLGTIENIGRIVETHRLTDVVVADRTIGYGIVIEGIRNAARTPVRFHMMQESGDLETAARPEAGLAKGWEFYRGRDSIAKRMQDKVLALLWPVVSAVARVVGQRPPKLPISGLRSVLLGRKRFVGGGLDDGGRAPLFSAAALYGGGELPPNEIEEIERYYASNRTFLLDCEIVLASIREGGDRSAVERAPLRSVLDQNRND